VSRRAKTRFGGGRARNVARVRQLTGARLAPPPPYRTPRVRGFLDWGNSVGIFLTSWQADVLTAIEEDRLDEEARSMRELGEFLGARPTDIDALIADVRRRTPAAPTDWAIARSHLAALAGSTNIDGRDPS
jgi:hypothetical protein